MLRTLAEPAEIEDLALTLEQGPQAFGYVAATVDQAADGVWVRVNIMVPVEGENPAVYVPPHSLPVVPSVPACDSPLVAASTAASGASGAAAPAAADATTPGRSTSPAPAATDPLTADGDLANTGGEPLLALGLFLIVGALATWQARRPRAARQRPGWHPLDIAAMATSEPDDAATPHDPDAGLDDPDVAPAAPGDGGRGPGFVVAVSLAVVFARGGCRAGRPGGAWRRGRRP